MGKAINDDAEVVAQATGEAFSIALRKLLGAPDDPNESEARMRARLKVQESVHTQIARLDRRRKR